MAKLNLSECIRWQHHRSGWGYCIDSLKSLHNSYGVLVVGSVEFCVRARQLIDKPWIGFVHNVPTHPSVMKKTYGEFVGSFDLSTMLNNPIWKSNFRHCKGLYCLSSDVADFLRQHVHVMVEVVYHATEIPETKFEWGRFSTNDDKKIIMVGHWMRNWQSIFDLEASGYKKCILRGVRNTFHYERIDSIVKTNSSVSYLDRLTDEEYDECLSKNIVFLSLYGSSANNAIIECIARRTPVIVNRLPATEEYLGEAYPLLYDDLEEVPLLLDASILESAHHFLETRVRQVMAETFVSSIANSEIYRSLPGVVTLA